MVQKLHEWQSHTSEGARLIVGVLPITTGVPQGSILGPLLFFIYFIDIPSVVDVCLLYTLFADDTLLYR